MSSDSTTQPQLDDTIDLSGGSGPLESSGYCPPDTKEGIEELCPVCGDKVSGYHYGLLTCESCKGFFKRTVQNKKVYTCVADRSCHIDKSQRKRCPFCRFQKCLDVGMKLEAVRADRMRGGRNKFGPMYKRDRARKLQLMRQKQIARAQCQGEPPPPPFPLYATPGGPGEVKQELIQIPQLSSSTSSPDSSPAPLFGGLQPPPPPPPAQQQEKSAAYTPQGQPPSPKGAGPASAYYEVYKVPHLIKELQLSMPDDKEWQSQLFGLLQSQTYNQCEVDPFELMCKVIDQSLFAQVDWARNSLFFKELKVDDQMKLLQTSWSDLLVLDHLHQRLHAGLPEEVTMHNGQKFSLAQMALLGSPGSTPELDRIARTLLELKFDPLDYICLKFLILLNPGEARNLSNLKLVHEAFERTQQALMEYTLMCYPQVTEKFSHLMALLPDIHAMSERGEEYLIFRHMSGSAPAQTLLMEMLHAKRK